MTAVLWLLLVQGAMGAFDTLYYHELRARLPSRPEARPELLLHATRDFIYAVIFATLPRYAFHGVWAGFLAVLLVSEIVITLADFVVEDEVRRPQGGVFPGERVMHALMAIVYGAMLGNLVPQMWVWAGARTALVASPGGPSWMPGLMGLMALGVGLSGVRDLVAATWTRRAV